MEVPSATIEVGFRASVTELGAAALLVRESVLLGPPLIEAVIDQEPAVVLAVVVGMLATPEPLVVTVVE